MLGQFLYLFFQLIYLCFWFDNKLNDNRTYFDFKSVLIFVKDIKLLLLNHLFDQVEIYVWIERHLSDISDFFLLYEGFNDKSLILSNEMKFDFRRLQ